MGTARVDPLPLLNRLLYVQYRSFPQYLAESVSPWTRGEDVATSHVVENIVADQQTMARRVSEEIQRLGGQVISGVFPMEYTDTHFLSLEFLVRELLRFQRRDVATLESLAGQLAGTGRPYELAAECLGSERQHLAALETLITRTYSSAGAT